MTKELPGDPAHKRFGPIEVNYLHGELIPSNHQILERWQNTPPEKIPVGQVIGVWLAVARLMGKNDTYAENNGNLVWNGNGYDQVSSKKKKK